MDISKQQWHSASDQWSNQRASVLRSAIVNRRREKVTALSLGCMLSTMSHGNLKGVQTFVDARVGHRHAYHRIVYRLLIFHQNQLH